MERYPNLKEEVAGSIHGCEISSLLDGLARQAACRSAPHARSTPHAWATSAWSHHTSGSEQLPNAIEAKPSSDRRCHTRGGREEKEMVGPEGWIARTRRIAGGVPPVVLLQFSLCHIGLAPRKLPVMW
jgi:hypothetical protein